MARRLTTIRSAIKRFQVRPLVRSSFLRSRASGFFLEGLNLRHWRGIWMCLGGAHVVLGYVAFGYGWGWEVFILLLLLGCLWVEVSGLFGCKDRMMLGIEAWVYLVCCFNSKIT
jgi:hypothetical protein